MSILAFLFGFCCLILIVLIAWVLGFFDHYILKQEQQRKSRALKRSQPLVPPSLERDTTLSNLTSSPLQVQEKTKLVSDHRIKPRQDHSSRKPKLEELVAVIRGIFNLLVSYFSSFVAGLLQFGYQWLTLLIWKHINPYGIFQLDMKQRLQLDAA